MFTYFSHINHLDHITNIINHLKKLVDTNCTYWTMAMAVGSMDRSEEFGGLDSEPERRNLASGKRLHNHGKCSF